MSIEEIEQIKAQAEVKLDKALNRFRRMKSNADIPDYKGFDNWIIRNEPVSIREALKNNDVISSTGTEQLAIQTEGFNQALFGRFLHYSQLVKTGRPSKKISSKFKLLNRWYSGLIDRNKEYLEWSLSREDLSFVEELDRDIEELSPVFIKHRMTEAISRGQKNVAYKLLGNLRQAEHDTNELEYLESRLALRSNDFDEAIKKANRVSENNIDFLEATNVKLEAFACLGDVHNFIDTIKSLPSQFKITSARFKRCLYIIGFAKPGLIPLLGKELEADWLSHKLDFTPNKLEEAECLTFVCKKAIEIIGILQKYMLRNSIEKAVGEDLSDIFGQLRSQDEYALMIIAMNQAAPSLLDCFSLDREDMWKPIYSILIPVQGLEARLLAIEVLHRFNRKREFVEYFLLSFKNLKPTEYMYESNLMETSYLVYREALVLGDEKLIEEAKSFVSRWTDNEKRIFEISKNAQLESLKLTLSEKTRGFLDSAEKQIISFRNYSTDWDDAGMISLGFYRTLELEIGERIISPLFTSTPLERLSGLIEKLEQKKKRIYWEGVLRDVKKFKENPENMITLGSMSQFLSRFKTEGGNDDEIKKLFLVGFSKIFNTDGLRSLKQGKLGELINEEDTKRFRNDPAHCRQVTLDTTEQSRAYVLESLEHLTCWLN